MLVQFGHSSVAETREQSSDGSRQFRGVAVGCAALAEFRFIEMPSRYQPLNLPSDPHRNDGGVR